MKISKQWLQDFVDISEVSAEDLMKTLTMHTVEVEEIIDQAAELQHIVVGEVVSAVKHENADSLKVCQVHVGEAEPLQVVCGGSNVREGMKIAMGMIGAAVKWHGEGDPIMLKKTKIRGELSFGMICAAEEIGLGAVFPKTDEKEILDITDLTDAPAGTPLAEALSQNNIVIDVDNKSMTHRPDLWGHYGIAREVAALYQQDLQAYTVSDIPASSEQSIAVSVKDTTLCARYMGVKISGVSIAPSPKWMQERLIAVGMNPINNIVDITNYVMLELGQPMHAFDAIHVAQQEGKHSITVRHAAKDEPITLLGGDERTLTEEMLVIADTQKVLAVAGVKGGEHSGVTETTTAIILEAANFDATSVRKTAAGIGIRTDSSTRFEKSLDPELVETAMKKAVALVLELCPQATVASSVVDVYPEKKDMVSIALDLTYLRTRIGAPVEQVFVTEVLTKLGFTVEEKGAELLQVTVPSWRATKDIAIQEDLIEEVARIFGYNNVPISLPTASISPAVIDPVKQLSKDIKALLAYEHGYTETYNYSFVSPEWLEKLGINPADYIELDNPIAKDRPLVRRSLLPNMLQNVEENAHRYDVVPLFEIGRTYRKDAPGELADVTSDKRLPLQEDWLGIVYMAKGEETPFFAISNVIRSIAERLGAKIEFKNEQEAMEMVHPGRSAEVYINGVEVGQIGELHPKTQQTIGIDHRVAMAEINVVALLAQLEEKSAYTPLAVYPSVSRDIAIVVDASVQDVKIKKAVRHVDTKVESVELFDVYEGEHVEAGKKSLAYRIVYRNPKETLTTEAVETLHNKVLAFLQERFGAVQR